MKTLFFRALLRLITRHAKFVMMASTGLAVASGLISWRHLEIKTNFKDTLSGDNETVAHATEIKDDFPSASTVYITVEGVDRRRMTAAALEVKKRLQRDHADRVAAVHLQLNIEFFKDYGLIYLRREDLAQLLRALRDYRRSLEAVVSGPGLGTLLSEIETSIDRGYAGGDTSFVLTQRVTGGLVFEQAPLPGNDRPGGLQLQSKIDRAQFRQEYEKTLIPILERMPLPPSEEQFIVWIEPIVEACRLAARIAHEGTELSPEIPKLLKDIERYQFRALGEMPDEYRFSKDGTMLLMEVAGTGDIHDIRQGEPFIETIGQVLSDVEEDYPEVKLGQTGFPVTYIEENHAVLDNFFLVMGLAVVGVLMIFIIGFGQARLPAISAVPMLYGLLYTFAIQALVIGELNMISLMFPVLLMGIGIDFAIHLISNFTEHREAGLSGQEAMSKTFETVGGGIITGALTTAAAFFAMLFANYRGVQHLGFISGVGIVMALGCMFTVLPVLVLWIDKREVRSGHPIHSVDFRWLGKMTELCLRYRYILLALFLGVTIFFAGQLDELELDRNVENIQPDGLQSAVLQQRILEKFDLSAEYAVFIAEDLDEARHIEKALGNRKTIGQVWSITSLIPEEKRQAENRPWIEAIRRELAEIGRVKTFECPVEPVDPIEPVEPVDETAPDGGAVDEPDPESDRAALTEFLEDRIRKRRIADTIRRESGLEVPDRLGSMKTSLARIKLAILDLSVIARFLYSDESEAQIGQLRDAVNDIDSSLVAGNDLGVEYLDFLIERKVQEIFCQLERMVSHTALGPGDLPLELRDRFSDESGSRYIVIAYPSQFPFEKRFLHRHIEELESVTVPKRGGVVEMPTPPPGEAEDMSPEELAARDKPKYSGVVPIWQTMIDKILYTLPRTLIATLVLVIVLLFLDLRSIKGVLIVMVPLAVGMIWTLGLVPLLGLKINVVSIMALPLIIGIGIDDGVHVFHRIYREGSARIVFAVESTGKAVLLTTLTNMIGFGSLMASVHRGFFHLGFLLSIGMIVCYLASVLLMPALMEIFWFTETRPQSD